MFIVRILTLALLLFNLATCATAQRDQSISLPSELKKKDARAFAAARSAYEEGRYEEARQRFDRIIGENPGFSSAYVYRSQLKRWIADYKGALADVRQSVTTAVSPPANSYVEIAELTALTGDFAGAVEAYTTYLNTDYVGSNPGRKAAAEDLLARARVAADLAANPVDFVPKPLPGGINTPTSLEYFPTVTAAGDRMIFTRRVNREQEDFYESRRNEQGEWSAAVPLQGLNSPTYDEGAQSVTADGSYLVFTACGRPDGAGGCDLYFAEREADGRWSAPRNLGNNVNTRFYEAQPSLSTDGNYLLFTSNRPGGRGKADLYLSRRTTAGGWSAPNNLGPVVNTAGDDRYPFWAADNQTLYFTSDGHPGLGGQDLFVTTLTTGFSEPRNLGYPINTAGNETNLFVALDGRTAYFSKEITRRGSAQTDVDIFAFQLPLHLRPRPATYLLARVVDAVSRQPLSATVHLSSPDAQRLASVRRADADGTFLTVLPGGTDWALSVDEPGYLFYSEQFTLTDNFTQQDPYELTIALQPLTEAPPVDSSRAEADGAIALRNVFFATGSADLLPVSAAELNRLADLLRGAPRFGVEIVGHTDNVGRAADNQALSERRAAAVREYLLTKGIDAARISTAGRGEGQPVAGNDTAAGRARNRRVTFRFLTP